MVIFLAYYSNMKFNWRTGIFIFLFILANFLDAIPLGKRRKSQKEDLICNIEDDHECICNRTLGNLDNIYTQCHEFMEVLFSNFNKFSI